MLDAAAGSANSILDSLADIAAALGGSVGSASGVSIGQRKGKWRVDPSGQGLVKGAGVLDFGDDAEAAAAYATKLLIERGVIGGVRESTQNLLKADGDLQAALDKALRWEDLMKEMATAANPFVAALNDLRGTFAGITDLAQEAGASTAELAKVQEFMVQRQQQLIDQAMASYRSTFFTDAENLAAAKGRIASTLGPLGHGSVDTVAEYKALVAATDALANPELFGALMELVDAFAAIKDAAEETAQAATEKIAVARAAVADAYARESSALSQTIDDATRAADRLREFRDSLASVGTAGANVNRLLAKVMTTGALAASGDLTAAGQLPTVGQDYLAAAKAGASSFTEYQRAVALVTGYANKAINANVSAADAAQRQLDAMTQEVEALSENTDTLVTLREAIDRLTALIGPGGNPASTPASQAGQRQVVDKLDGMHRAIEQSTVSVNRLRRLHEGWDRGGAQAVTSDSTQPVVTA
jgi:hypothetical protein